MSLASRERQAAKESHVDRHRRQVEVQNRHSEQAFKASWEQALDTLRGAIRNEHPEFSDIEIDIAVRAEVKAAEQRQSLAIEREARRAKEEEESAAADRKAELNRSKL